MWVICGNNKLSTIDKMIQRTKESPNYTGSITQLYRPTNSSPGSNGVTLTKEPPVDPNAQNICNLVVELGKAGLQVRSIFTSKKEDEQGPKPRNEYLEQNPVTVEQLLQSPSTEYFDFTLVFSRKSETPSYIRLKRDWNHAPRPRFRVDAKIPDSQKLEEAVEILRVNAFDYEPKDMIKLSNNKI